MNGGYRLHEAGDCNPYSCVICDNECAVCGNWLKQCTCPTLPLDEEEDE